MKRIMFLKCSRDKLKFWMKSKPSTAHVPLRADQYDSNPGSPLLHLADQALM
jgi:hypothetical protein